MKPDTRAVLGGALIALLAGALIAAFATGNRDLTNTLAVGVLSAVSTIVGFYFGSSKASATKDETISALAKGDGP